MLDSGTQKSSRSCLQVEMLERKRLHMREFVKEAQHDCVVVFLHKKVLSAMKKPDDVARGTRLRR
jgi:hypothetical protein